MIYILIIFKPNPFSRLINLSALSLYLLLLINISINLTRPIPVVLLYLQSLWTQHKTSFLSSNDYFILFLFIDYFQSFKRDFIYFQFIDFTILISRKQLFSSLINFQLSTFYFVSSSIIQLEFNLSIIFSTIFQYFYLYFSILVLSNE